MYGTFTQVFSSTAYWGTFFVTIAIANGSSFIVRFWDNCYYPTPTVIVREKIKLHQTTSIDPPPVTDPERPVSLEHAR